MLWKTNYNMLYISVDRKGINVYVENMSSKPSNTETRIRNLEK